MSVIAEAGCSHAQAAAAFDRVAAENGARKQARVGRSHVSHWIAESTPSGCAPAILRETWARV